MDAPNCFPNQISHRKNSQLGKMVIVGYGNGVGNNHLFKQTTGKTINGWLGKNSVGSTGINLTSTLGSELTGSFRQLTGGVNHVIHQHGSFPVHVTDEIQYFCHIMALTTFIDNGQGGIV